MPDAHNFIGILRFWVCERNDRHIRFDGLSYFGPFGMFSIFTDAVRVIFFDLLFCTGLIK